MHPIPVQQPLFIKESPVVKKPKPCLWHQPHRQVLTHRRSPRLLRPFPLTREETAPGPPCPLPCSQSCPVTLAWYAPVTPGSTGGAQMDQQQGAAAWGPVQHPWSWSWWAANLRRRQAGSASRLQGPFSCLSLWCWPWAWAPQYPDGQGPRHCAPAGVVDLQLQQAPSHLAARSHQLPALPMGRQGTLVPERRGGRRVGKCHPGAAGAWAWLPTSERGAGGVHRLNPGYLRGAQAGLFSCKEEMTDGWGETERSVAQEQTVLGFPLLREWYWQPSRAKWLSTGLGRTFGQPCGSGPAEVRSVTQEHGMPRLLFALRADLVAEVCSTDGVHDLSVRFFEGCLGGLIVLWELWWWGIRGDSSVRRNRHLYEAAICCQGSRNVQQHSSATWSAQGEVFRWAHSLMRRETCLGKKGKKCSPRAAEGCAGLSLFCRGLCGWQKYVAGMVSVSEMTGFCEGGELLADHVVSSQQTYLMGGLKSSHSL